MTEKRPTAAIILAAGAGTRMKSATPKVLHEISGRSLVGHALAAAEGVGALHIVVVVRHEREAVAAHVSAIAREAVIADQDEIPGTGSAVACGLDRLDAELGFAATGLILVTSGDVPLVDSGTLAQLAAAHVADKNAVTMLTAIVDDPSGYGRIVRNPVTGEVARIVEDGDATPEEREIREINAGLYAFDSGVLRDALDRLHRDNSQGEQYLTDVVALAREAGGSVRAVIVDDAMEVEGVNDRVQLARVGAALNARILEHWMTEGVTVVDPATTWVDVGVTLAPDVTLLPGTHLAGATRVEEKATIGPDTTLRDCIVKAGASVVRSHGSGAEIGPDAVVGPFSYLRPGTHLGAGGKIGAFVETKNAEIGDGSKVPHLSYVGDVVVGVESNVGAGTIVANFDGVSKHRTTIGSHVRIGSDNTLVAPVKVGDGAYTGAGTTVRKDVPPGALAINPASQENREGWVAKNRPGTAAADAAERAAEKN